MMLWGVIGFWMLLFLAFGVWYWWSGYMDDRDGY